MHFDNKVVVRTDIPTQRVLSYTIVAKRKYIDLRTYHIVLDGFPALRERAQHPPSFRPMSIVATVAHLSYC